MSEEKTKKMLAEYAKLKAQQSSKPTLGSRPKLYSKTKRNPQKFTIARSGFDQPASSETIRAVISARDQHDDSPDVNPKWTHLQKAALDGDLARVEKLLAENAQINAPARGYDGYTALGAACAAGHEAIAKKLIAAGANLNARGGYFGARTPLQEACTAGHKNLVVLLLDSGADILAPAGHYHGRTALQAAAEAGHLEIVEYLLDKGAWIYSPAAPSGGISALSAAAASGNLAVANNVLARSLQHLQWRHLEDELSESVPGLVKDKRSRRGM